MTDQLRERTDYWEKHYNEISRSKGASNKSLDYSNDRVQIQTFGQIVGSIGSARHKKVLDVGCGWGELSLCLAALGAEVTGVDIAMPPIEKLSEDHPTINWKNGDFSHSPFATSLGYFDIVLAVEILQYVDFVSAMNLLWERVSPGGRFIGVIPNSDCPIVQDTMIRFDGRYIGVNVAEIQKVVQGLEGSIEIEVTGFVFQDNQRISPYKIATIAEAEELTTPPNRLMFTVLKSEN